MPIKYVPFIPEPVEGQAVLGNFNRILRYKGADDVSMTIQRGMPLYEMEKRKLWAKTPMVIWLFVENVFLPVPISKSKAFKLTLFTLTHHLQVVPITQRKYIFVEIRK